MEKPKQDRWRRPGMRLAILGLIALSIYFLAIFVQQSVRVYQLSQERRAQEQVLEQLEQENARLRAIIEANADEEQIRLLVKENLPLVEPSEKVAVPYEAPGTAGKPEEAATPTGPTLEELTALPAWQQWLRMIFYPAMP